MAYDNRGRTATAQRTQRRIVAAARSSFIDVGYAATTIRQIAADAEVSAETIYKTFGNKAGLLKRVYDVTMSGDEDLVPLADRPQARAVAEATNPLAAARAWAELVRTLSERAATLLEVLLPVRASDPDLAAFADTLEAERLTGARLVAEWWHRLDWLRPPLIVATARDILWTLDSPEVFFLLRRRGWDDVAYTRWLADTVSATVLIEA